MERLFGVTEPFCADGEGSSDDGSFLARDDFFSFDDEDILASLGDSVDFHEFLGLGGSEDGLFDAQARSNELGEKRGHASEEDGDKTPELPRRTKRKRAEREVEALFEDDVEDAEEESEGEEDDGEDLEWDLAPFPKDIFDTRPIDRPLYVFVLYGPEQFEMFAETYLGKREEGVHENLLFGTPVLSKTGKSIGADFLLVRGDCWEDHVVEIAFTVSSAMAERYRTITTNCTARTHVFMVNPPMGLHKDQCGYIYTVLSQQRSIICCYKEPVFTETMCSLFEGMPPGHSSAEIFKASAVCVGCMEITEVSDATLSACGHRMCDFCAKEHSVCTAPIFKCPQFRSETSTPCNSPLSLPKVRVVCKKVTEEKQEEPDVTPMDISEQGEDNNNNSNNNTDNVNNKEAVEAEARERQMETEFPGIDPADFADELLAPQVVIPTDVDLEGISQQQGKGDDREYVDDIAVGSQKDSMWDGCFLPPPQDAHSEAYNIGDFIEVSNNLALSGDFCLETLPMFPGEDVKALQKQNKAPFTLESLMAKPGSFLNLFDAEAETTL